MFKPALNVAFLIALLGVIGGLFSILGWVALLLGINGKKEKAL